MCWYMNRSKQGKSNGGEERQMKQKEQQRKERKANKSGMEANRRDEDNSKTRERGENVEPVQRAQTVAWEPRTGPLRHHTACISTVHSALEKTSSFSTRILTSWGTFFLEFEFLF